MNFSLNAHTLHLEIVLLTPEIRAHKVKFWSALETIGSVKGPCHKFISQAYCKRKSFRVSRTFCNFAIKTFANFEFRLCLVRNFHKKCQKTRKSRKFLPLKYFCRVIEPDKGVHWQQFLSPLYGDHIARGRCC